MEHKRRPAFRGRNADDQLAEVKNEFKQIWNALPDKTKKIIRNSSNASKPQVESND